MRKQLRGYRALVSLVLFQTTVFSKCRFRPAAKETSDFGTET